MIKKKLLLSAILTLGVATAVCAIENPIKNYNLYADTHKKDIEAARNDNYERGMSDYYQNNQRKAPPSSGITPTTQPTGEQQAAQQNKRRNEVLRESSQKKYADSSTPAKWTQGPSFYKNPSLESIKQKYKKSNFAGCLQECESYVRLHPNDTLGFYYLAMCYSKVNDKENAIKAYEKVISLNANPMIVKYATNGRNCILGGSEACYPDVNKPDLIYPHANIAESELTPVDPQTLINRNLTQLEQKLSPTNPANNAPQGAEGGIKGAINNAKDAAQSAVNTNMPFSNQDEKLDEFIKAPYGSGLAPELDKEYKQIQLRKLQQTINKQDNNPETEYLQREDIKKFDNNKSDNDSIKLAYEIPQTELDKLSKDPQYIQTKRELQELKMMLGSNSKNSDDDMLDLLQDYSKEGEKLSPEMLEAIMVKEMMPDFMFVNTKDIL